MEPSELDNRTINDDQMNDDRNQREEEQQNNEQIDNRDSQMNESEQPQSSYRNYGSSNLDQPLSSSRYDNEGERRPYKSIKKQKASMIPRVISVVPEPVKDIQRFLIKIADLVSITSEDSFHENASLIANALADSDDLKTYKEEISEYFIKCLIQLTNQITTHTSLISLITNSHPDFVQYLLQKIEKKLLEALEKDEINNSKNLLASYSCFVSTGLINVSSYLNLLNVLISKSFDNYSQLVSTYLISYSLPYSLEKLSQSEEGYKFLVDYKSYLEDKYSNYTSPFSTEGIQAIFTTSDEEMHTQSPRLIFHAKSNGATDNFYELISLIVEFINDIVVKKSNNGVFLIESLTFPQVWKSLSDSLQSYNYNISEEFFNNLNLIFNSIGSSLRFSYPVVGSSILGEAASYGRHNSWLTPRFSILTGESNTQVAEVDGLLNNVDKYFLGLYIHDILVHFDPIINDDGTKLGSVNLLCSHLHSLNKIIQFSLAYSSHSLKLIESNEDSSEELKNEITLKNEENKKKLNSLESVIPLLIMEHLFQHLLIIPQQHVHFSQICSVILTLCKKFTSQESCTSPAPYSQYVALILMSTLTHIVHLDVAEGLHNIIVEFFSFLFINSKNQWPHWDYWGGIIGLNNNKDNKEEEDEEAVGKYFYSQFIYLLLHKLSRLLNKETLYSFLPPYYKNFVSTLYIDESPNSQLYQYITNNSSNLTSSAVRFYKHPDYNESFTFDNEDLIKKTASELYEKLMNREETDNLLDYLESLPKLSKNYENADILGPLFLHCLILVAWSSETLTSFTGMLEKYNEVIKLTADSEDLQKKLVQTILTVCGPNDHLLQFVINEMLRLNQISVTSLLSVFLNPIFLGSIEIKFKFFSNIPSSISLIKQVILRSIDFVKASLAQKVDTIVKESQELSESDRNSLIDNELKNILNTIDNIDLNSEDPKILLDSSLKQSIKNANVVYSQLSNLFSANSLSAPHGLNEEQFHQLKAIHHSLTNFLNRVFQGNQKYLEHKYGINISLY